MPRTHRYLRGSRSVSYKANKNRSFARRSDRDSHKINRIDNLYANEITFEKFNCKIKRTVKGLQNKDSKTWKNWYGQPSNVPNEYQKFVFVNNGQTLKEQLISYLHMSSDQKIEHFENIKNGTYDFRPWFSENYIQSSLKQLKRRGELRPFVSHRKGNVSRKDY